jgi:4'-phosphopantetheinyl transferase
LYSRAAVRVYGVDLRSGATLSRCLALLDQGERTRADRFTVEPPRRQFVITRGALRLLLAREVGCPAEALAFGAGRHGKPFLLAGDAPAEVAFNVSHSGTRGLIAIGRGAVGVDIEFTGCEADLDLVARGVFTPAEQAALQRKAGRDRATLFFRLWTQKEALIKARGCGFAYPPRQFTLPAALVGGAREAPFTFPGEAAPTWLVTDLSEGDYAAALVQASP